MASKLDFTKNTFAVITGASQGIGRTIAIEISRRLNPSSKLLLIARSEKGLMETKKLISDVNNSFEVAIYPSDLSKMEAKDYDEMFKKELKKESYQLGLIVHNAGQLGEMNKAATLNDISAWRNYFDLNFFSVAVLNSEFLRNFGNISKDIYIINITSLCGRAPFKDLSMYGSGKAARDLFFKVLAEEEKELIVLNYSPGPIKTAMAQCIATNAKDEDLRNMFLKTDNLLTCEQTVAMLMSIIEKGDFKSGDIIDYYDRC